MCRHELPQPPSHRYDRSDNTWRQVLDARLVAAMGPPGGGRNPVSGRLLRHFNVIAINEFGAWITCFTVVIGVSSMLNAVHLAVSDHNLMPAC